MSATSAGLCLRPSAAPHPGDVHLADHVLPSVDVLGGPGDEDAFALAASVGFTDVRLVLLGPDVGLEVAEAADRDSGQDGTGWDGGTRIRRK